MLHSVLKINKVNATDKLIKKLDKIAKADSYGRNYEPTRSVYIIEVENLIEGSNWDYYVGMTGNSIEQRFQEHIDGYNTWRNFKKGICKPVRLEYSLCSFFPKFHTQEAAKLAEGEVARFLRELGYEVYSDMIDK